MRLITIIISILMAIGSSNLAYSEDNVKTYRFNEETNISGVLGSSSKFFYVENNINVSESKLNLVFTKSELLDPVYSTLTVYINDIPISSQKLSGEKIYKNQTSITIPNDLITNGYNEIKIKAYKTISDQICRDDNNSANWLVIHDDTNISIKYNYKESKNIISDYENIFMNIDNSQKVNTTIILTKDYSSAQLTGGLIMSSDIGKKIKYNNYNFDFVTYDKFNNKNDNIIFIGKETNTPTEILNLLTDTEKNNLKENCVIKVVNSVFNPNKKMMLILSNNDELIINGCKLLSSNELIKSIDKDTIIINKDSNIDDITNELNNNTIYFKDLGYEDIYLKGPFTQEVSIDINTQKSKIVSSTSKLKLRMRYADNLDFDRSLATIYINDIPIGSKNLEKDKCNEDTIELTLPKEVLKKNYYQIKVVFNLELKDLACVTRDMETPWAYILNDSYIDFAYSDNNELKLSNYPYPFINDYSFNSLSIVIPDTLSSKELTNVANIVSFMGHDIKYNNGIINIVRESEIGSLNKEDNLIIIGTPSNNKLIRDYNNNLNLKFRKDFLGFESDDKVKFVDDVDSQVSTIQLIKSPYSDNKTAMVIASTNMNDLSLSAKYLTDLSLTKALSGDTIVIYRNGYIQDLSYKSSLNNDREEEHIKENKINKQGKIFIIISVFIVTTVIVSLVLLMRRHKRY